MYRLLTLIANPIHTFLLGSPFHRLVSHRMILLTFYGRKSGTCYSFPVYYACTGEDIRFVASRTSRWWLNLLRGTWIRVRLRGIDYDAVVEHIPASHARMVDALVAFDPGLTKERAETIADSKVMFNVRLQTERATVAHHAAGAD